MFKKRLTYFKSFGLLFGLFLLVLGLLGCSKVESLIPSDTKLTLSLEEEKQITLTIEPKDQEFKIEWSSENDEIATVSSTGLIKAIAIGKTNINVKVGGLSAKIEVEVKIINFNVIFNSNLGSEVPIATVQKGKTVAIPDDPIKEGHDFKGWFTAPNLAIKYNFNTPITSNLTLYAGWEQLYVLINFVTNGGTEIDDVEKPLGSALLAVDLAQATTKVGHAFVGWYLDNELTNEVELGSSLSEDLTVYAKWAVNDYMVSFEPNNGTQMQDVQLRYGTLLDVVTPSKAGYIFSGWYKDDGMTKSFAVDSEFISEDLTLYAKWDLGNSTVKFNTNGGSEISDVIVATLNKVQAPATPTKENYLFTAWYMDSRLTQVYDFDSIVEGVLTLYAKWELDPSAAHLVEFVLNGGQFPINTTDFFIQNGVTPILNHSKIIYNGSPWSDETNKILYLQTTVTTGGYWFKIGLKRNDLGLFVVAGIAKSGSVTMSDYDYVICAWDQSGAPYSFCGKIKLGDIITITGADVKNASNAQIFEGAIVNVYNAGSEYQELNKNLILGEVTLPIPYKAGAKFGGWYKDPSFTGDAVTKLTESVTLYAKWN